MANKMNIELVNKISAEYVKVWGNDTNMNTYCNNKVKNAVEMHDGSIVLFENPAIEKHFYFGYSDCGQGVSYDDNNNRIEFIKKNKLSYFYRHNLKNCFAKLFIINTNDKYRKAYLCKKYDKANICTVNMYDDYEVNILKFKPVEMTEDDIIAYNKIVKIERKRFVTRLNSYIKKYRDSKIDIDSYWADR